jgi:hypothetical protein
MLYTPIAPLAMASDAQSPNVQILSSNTSNDFNSWERMSMLTDQPFHFTSTNNLYSYQMNAILNGCAYGSSSCTWWLQGVVGVVSASGNEANLDYAKAEVWYGSNGPNFCWYYPGTTANLNQTGYDALQQINLLNSSAIQMHVSVANSGGTDIDTNTQTCTYASAFGSSTHGPVDFFSQVEGVIVGDVSAYHVTFKPLSSTLFYGYIDLVSNYNHMSSSSQSTQTGESSNLYQICGTGCPYSESYGSMYLYTVQTDENTETAT